MVGQRTFGSRLSLSFEPLDVAMTNVLNVSANRGNN